ncbi:MAG: DUF4245 domain-containing protein [Actinomycetes bacterium]
MSRTTVGGEPTATDNLPARRRGGSVLDLLRTLAVVGLFAAVILALTPRPHSTGVRVVDYQPALVAVRGVAPFAVLAPVGLPSGWQATSVRYDEQGGFPVWHLGFVAPGPVYASLEQSSAPGATFLARQVPSAVAAGTREIAGASWTRYQGSGSMARAYVRVSARDTVIVTGSASWAQLAVLAGSLRS